MPSRSEDRFFGGKPGSARKAYEGCIKTYGLSKGEEVYAALVQKRRALAHHKRKKPR